MSSKSKGSWQAFIHLNDNRFRPINVEDLGVKSVIEVINNPYVFRFDLPQHGRIYFIGLCDDLYHYLTSQSKQIQWLHELFQRAQDQFQAKNRLSKNETIYEWSLNDVWQILQEMNHSSVQIALEVFPRSTMVGVRE